MRSSPDKEMSKNCHAWAARDDSGLLSPYEFERRGVESDHVSVRITHCGICYADVVYTRNKMKKTVYPLVPGHEIVGIVTEVGGSVGKFKIGDYVGVGTYLDSCRACENCEDAQEIYCLKGVTMTINGTYQDGSITQGGYSSFIVVHERYCYKIPEKYPPALAAPLLCAGITVYSPMIHHKTNEPEKSIGVIGLGGLGHMAVKFAKAFGLTVTVFSTSISKKDDALSLLKADNFVISSDKEQMAALSKTLDFIIDTASGDHPFDLYLSLLKIGGVLALVG
ncbi:probable cinnamyl alcohol dehydrogenase 1 [Rhodamnia argentea]|uniref:Probable cinnamyl alcohol dehydrogenase 1 n=1 Tax=Rhodamnia argentea TaxID=178133 RepID=A0ABM3HYT3_9MYRT|nr:probable cinnamyl alcohol dehydrogenase 1 [Rhodamnia argentea]